MRQFRRLQRIRLKTSDARTVPASFMTRLIRAHRDCPWTDRSDASIIHRRDCGIRRGARCDCEPEVFLTIDSKTVEVDAVGRCKRETRQ
jgi:hypothetical protein